ncbi:MAG: M1 family metallopeptidase [Acidimicrobiia bacterium]|nr:M1 family metallopeptidase [Acidimicrobiia bacterium]
MRSAALVFLMVLGAASDAAAQQKPQPPSTMRAPSRTDILRGEYGRYRANNDLLHYDLDIRVNPEKKFISGKNTVRFKMLRDDNRIQLELFSNYTVEKVVMGAQALNYQRDHNTVYIDFPETLRNGRTYSIEFHYSGQPREEGRFGALAFRTTPDGRHWINTANEGEGSASWWPSKDQWRDEPNDGADIRVAVPNGLTNVSNGRFMGKTDLGDGYTRWDYRVHYPINSYNVSLNIAEYAHFAEVHGNLTMDYFVLPGNLEKAKVQFAQAKPMLEAFEKHIGPYPFPKDGFKLIEVPYSGMEHQSAVTYGNRYANGYLERDWTGVGVSLKFDFIIIHESAHEWYGNSISAADVSDMWIQEGWCNYLEFIYVEALFGREDAIKYANGYKSKVGNREPIITQRGIHRTPNQDMYFKGALFLDTLRNAVNDDARWWKLMRDTYDRFKYQNIMTEDLAGFFSAELKRDMTPIFDQYLRRADLPVLELTFDEAARRVSYRWRADERGFALPIKVGDPAKWRVIQPAADWKSMEWAAGKDAFKVATELFYVNVQVLDANGRLP